MINNQFIILTSNSYKQIIKQNNIQIRHEFQNICLDWQSSGVSAYFKSKRSMTLILFVKGNLR
jgi:hypothetical protein